MATKKVTRSTSQGKRQAARAKTHDRREGVALVEALAERGVKLGAGPAAQLREAEAKLAEIRRTAVPPPRMPTERHPASDTAVAVGKVLESIQDMPVPMTLGKLCRVIGPNVDAQKFASTALMSLAIQLEGIESIAEQDNSGCYDRWCCVESIVDRMRLAANVTAWLESDEPMGSLPEVQP